ncbi:MAG: hypothetical protein EOO24_44830 [Comamonadaceae bacterium]|nr:MAG: hypothetical protein EOO24_44830 [Comamonadaceae bacterium]
MSLKKLTLAATLALTALTAAAQPAWPSKPITVIVPYAAGTSPDVVVRNIGPELGRRLGQQVLVENITGAGGAIGTERAVRSAADGHTLVLGVESTVLIASMVSPSTVKYDGQKDLVPVTLMASAPLVLVGKPALAANTLPELMQMLRANPDKFSYGTSGVGTSLHLAGEIFNQVAGTKLTHVPYRVSSQLVTELAGNQIDLAVLPVGTVAQQIRAGKIKGFGCDLAGAARSGRHRRDRSAEGSGRHRLVRPAGPGRRGRHDRQPRAQGSGRDPAGPGHEGQVR